MTVPVKHISISIERPNNEVYQFASSPENFPKWLAFIKSMSKESGNTWRAETDMGPTSIKLIPANDLGIIDHTVTLEDGTIVHNPLRVIQNKTGSEVIFTLFQMPEKTNEEFEADSDLVKADLATLKKILEND